MQNVKWTLQPLPKSPCCKDMHHFMADLSRIYAFLMAAKCWYRAAASGLNLSFQNTLSSSNKKSKWYMYTNIFQNNLSSSNNLSSHFPRLLFIWFKFPTFPSVQSVQSVQSLSLSKSKYQVLEVWRLHWAWLLAGGTGTFSNMNSFC